MTNLKIQEKSRIYVVRKKKHKASHHGKALLELEF